MKRKTCLLLFICVLAAIGLPALAQQRPVTVSATVTEEETKMPVMQASVLLLSLPDSSQVARAASDNQGRFTLSARPGKYLLRISFIGLETAFLPLSLTRAKRAVQLGEIKLKTDELVLQEAVVTAEAPPVTVKGDTTEYSASAYRVPEGADLEELVKLLPGAEIDENGKLTVNGKPINKVMVDGEEFFTSNPKAALKDLTADMVSKLKVYNKKSDFAKVTGVDDGKEDMVLDLKLKPHIKQGWNGNLRAGYGQKHYDAKAQINRFRGKMNLSATGTANSNGMDESKRGGINFSQRTAKLRYGANVEYRRSDRQSWSKQTTEEFLDDNATQHSNRQSNSANGGNNVSASFRFEWEADSLTRLFFRPSFSYSDGNSRSGSLSETQDTNHKPINRKEASDTQQNRSLSTQGSLMVNRKLNSRGRNLILNFNYNLNGREADRNSLSNTAYYNYGDSVKVQNQRIDNTSGGYDYRVRLTYMEPLLDRCFLEMGYGYQNRMSRSEKYAYNWDPSLEDYSQEPDTAYSNCYENRYSIHTVKALFHSIRDKYIYNIGIEAEAEKSSNRSYLQDSTTEYLSRNVVNYAPSFFFRYNFSKDMRIHVNYDGHTSQPGMNDLQPVTDISDPLNIRMGNPDLKSSYSNSVSVSFSNYFPKTFGNINANLSYRNTLNSVTRIVTYDMESGVRTTRPTNINGNWNANGGLTFSSPLRNKKFTLNNSAHASIGNTVGYNVIDRKSDAVKTRTRNLSLSEQIRGNYRCEQFDVGLSAGIRYHKSDNSFNRDNRRETYDYTFRGNTNINLPWDIKVSTDANCQLKQGYGEQIDGCRIIWNAQIAKSFLKKKKATVRVNFYDLLRQRDQLSRSISANAITDRESSVSNVYFMAYFTYRFNTFGKKK